MQPMTLAMWLCPFPLQKCNLCDFASSRANNLRTHLKTHTGEKSNKCNQCDYSSSHTGALRRHLKTHSGEKSNKCNQCDYASSDAGDLRIHSKMHSGEKSNKCNQCDYASSGAGNSRTQFKMHSAQCAHCTVSFPRNRTRWDMTSHSTIVISFNIFFPQLVRLRGKHFYESFCELQTLNLWFSLNYTPVSTTEFWRFMPQFLSKYMGILLSPRIIYRAILDHVVL